MRRVYAAPVLLVVLFHSFYDVLHAISVTSLRSSSRNMLPPDHTRGLYCPDEDSNCLSQFNLAHVVWLEGLKPDVTKYDPKDYNIRWVLLMMKADRISYYDGGDGKGVQPNLIAADGTTLIQEIPFLEIMLPCRGGLCSPDHFLRKARKKYSDRYRDYPTQIQALFQTPEDNCVIFERVVEDQTVAEVHFFCSGVKKVVDTLSLQITMATKYYMRDYLFSEKAMASCKNNVVWRSYIQYTKTVDLNLRKGYSLLTRFKLPIFQEKDDAGGFVMESDLLDANLPMLLGVSDDKYHLGGNAEKCCLQLKTSNAENDVILCATLNDDGKEDRDCLTRAQTLNRLLNLRATFRQDPLTPDECAFTADSVSQIRDTCRISLRYKMLSKMIALTPAEQARTNPYYGDLLVEKKTPEITASLQQAYNEAGVKIAGNSGGGAGGSNPGEKCDSLSTSIVDPGSLNSPSTSQDVNRGGPLSVPRGVVHSPTSGMPSVDGAGHNYPVDFPASQIGPNSIPLGPFVAGVGAPHGKPEILPKVLPSPQVQLPPLAKPQKVVNHEVNNVPYPGAPAAPPQPPCVPKPEDDCGTKPARPARNCDCEEEGDEDDDEDECGCEESRRKSRHHRSNRDRDDDDDEDDEGYRNDRSNRGNKRNRDRDDDNNRPGSQSELEQLRAQVKALQDQQEVTTSQQQQTYQQFVTSGLPLPPTFPYVSQVVPPPTLPGSPPAPYATVTTGPQVAGYPPAADQYVPPAAPASTGYEPTISSTPATLTTGPDGRPQLTITTTIHPQD